MAAGTESSLGRMAAKPRVELMEFVLDANILMAMLISGKAQYLRLVRERTFFIPEFLFVELAKYQVDIVRTSRLSGSEWTIYATSLFMQLRCIPRCCIAPENFNKASNWLVDIDPKDTDYLALSLQLDIPLLTRDRPLWQGVRKKGYQQIILFNEFLTGI